MVNHYETVFILTPVLSDEQIKEAVNKLKTYFTEERSEIINEEQWGLRKLAYPIEKKNSGFYFFIEFKAFPSFIAKLETQFRRNEKVLRFLTFRQDKNFIEYAAKRRMKYRESIKDISL